ncbi:hypothetical protein [Actinoallomurus rhizosphaericola]|nr:hypothetical protein [Actinoallomurus rhizosphaericola]MCO5993355.1 hypothetical protein [Actinoallomurus rhizosphaericola]
MDRRRPAKAFMLELPEHIAGPLAELSQDEDRAIALTATYILKLRDAR